jgi:ABC-type transporter Mla subunit MlaD
MTFYMNSDVVLSKDACADENTRIHRELCRAADDLEDQMKNLADLVRRNVNRHSNNAKLSRLIERYKLVGAQIEQVGSVMSAHAIEQHAHASKAFAETFAMTEEQLDEIEEAFDDADDALSDPKVLRERAEATFSTRETSEFLRNIGIDPDDGVVLPDVPTHEIRIEAAGKERKPDAGETLAREPVREKRASSVKKTRPSQSCALVPA